MDYLRVYKTPRAKMDYLVVAFKGWSDAGEGATEAVHYLGKKLGAKKLAELDPEEFYDFTHARPHIRLDREGIRQLSWPSNELFYRTAERWHPGLILFLGTEPSLKWRTYCDTIIDLAIKSNVHTVVHVGALLDTVPHTRDVRVSCSANVAGLRAQLEELDVRHSSYQGPSGISSAMMERCSEKGLNFATLWGHTPHYLQASPNYGVIHGILQTLFRLIPMKMDITELRAAASAFQNQVQRLVEKDFQLKTYVEKLEERYDQTVATSAEMLNAEEVVKGLEKFLKDQRGGGRGT